jgi:hypothetical protein
VGFMEGQFELEVATALRGSAAALSGSGFGIVTSWGHVCVHVFSLFHPHSLLVERRESMIDE